MTTIRRTIVQATRYGDQKEILKKAKKSTSPRSKSTMPSFFPEINERIRKIREAMSISQQELAEKLSSPGVNVSLSTIKAIENDVSSPNLYIIRKLKKISGKSYNWILDGSNL